MQAIPQDLSLLITNLLQGEGGLSNATNLTQLADIKGKNVSPDFLAALQDSLQSLLQGGFSPGGGDSPEFSLADLEDILRQYTEDSGKTLPFDLATLSELQNVKKEAVDTALLHGGSENKSDNSASPSSSRVLPAQTPQSLKVLEDVLAQVRMERPVLNDGLAEKAGEVRSQIGLVFHDEIKAQPQLKQELMRAINADIRPVANADARPVINNQPVDPGINPLNQSVDLSQQVAMAVRFNNGEQKASPGPLLETSMFNQQVDDMISPINSFSANRASPGAVVADAKPVQMFINTPLQEPQWQNEFTSRVTMLAKGGVQTAEIRLNPPHMGPIEVRVVLNDDMANITFTAQHSTVRDAIESALPRLREMFTSTGLQLADAQVSDQQLHDQRYKQSSAFGGNNNQSADGYDLSTAQNDEEQLVEAVHYFDSSSASSLSSIDLYA